MNTIIELEIDNILEEQVLSREVLLKFAQTVLASNKVKSTKPKKLSLQELKEAVYTYFGVSSTKSLTKSKTFKQLCKTFNLNLKRKDAWEKLYRKFIGLLPNEKRMDTYGCINGIDIFKYDMPRTVLGVEANSSTQEIKKAYRQLSKIYHPDNSQTGDANIFNRITVLYQSILEQF